MIKWLVFGLTLSFSAHALTIKEYAKKRNGYHITFYVSGYFDAIYENIYALGGCYRKSLKKTDLTYENFKPEIDLMIRQKLDTGELLENDGLDKVILPLLLRNLDCKQSDAIKLAKPAIAKPLMATKPISSPKKASDPFASKPTIK